MLLLYSVIGVVVIEPALFPFACDEEEKAHSDSNEGGEDEAQRDAVKAQRSVMAKHIGEKIAHCEGGDYSGEHGGSCVAGAGYNAEKAEHSDFPRL